MKYFYNLLMAVVLCSFAATTWASEYINGEEVKEVEWEALMPENFSLDDVFDVDKLYAFDDFDPKAQLVLDEMMVAMQSAPIVPELNGNMVKIPGYVVPVEADGQRVTGFFLVPYFGACIHMPPPPSNQIVYVEFEPGTKVENLYDAIWVTGKLATETKQHELATSGYTMEAFQIEPYTL